MCVALTAIPKEKCKKLVDGPNGKKAELQLRVSTQGTLYLHNLSLNCNVLQADGQLTTCIVPTSRTGVHAVALVSNCNDCLISMGCHS